MLERQGDEHRVELVANVGHGVTLVVNAREDALESTLDQALDRMGRVLNRHKTKQTDKHRRGGRVGH